MNTQPTNEQPTQDKLPYQTPEIIAHGSLETITQAGNGGFSDALSASGIPV